MDEVTSHPLEQDASSSDTFPNVLAETVDKLSRIRSSLVCMFTDALCLCMCVSAFVCELILLDPDTDK